jgi:hypothetical protein
MDAARCAPLADAKAIALTLAALDLRSVASDGRAQRRASWSSSVDVPPSLAAATGLCQSPTASSPTAGSTTAAPCASRQRPSPTGSSAEARHRRGSVSSWTRALSATPAACASDATAVPTDPAVAALLAAFTGYASAVQAAAPALAAGLPHYAVALGAGPVGMVLRLVGHTDDGGECGFTPVS